MIFWLLVLLAGAAAIPVVNEFNRDRMTDVARKEAPGRFAQLTHGTVHYDWAGPARGPVCVCIHGLTTSSYVWGGMTRGLALMGYRVLTYDHFGRGFSDRPKVKHDDALYVKTLHELLAHEKIEGEVTLIGYSMGGAVATLYAAQFPDRIRQLILLAPAGMGLVRSRVMRLVTETPLIGDWLMLARYPSVLRKGIKAERRLSKQVKGIGKMQAGELEWYGFVPAVLASLRGILGRSLKAEHQAIHEACIPVLALWGEHDDIIPISALGVLAEWSRDAQQDVVEGATHALPYTHAEEVLDFIRAHPPEY